MYKLILIVLAFSATLIFSKDLDQDSVLALPADVAFSKIYVSVEGGEIYPWGDLIDAVENSLYGGVGFRYSYWDNADGFVSFAYSYFKPVPNSFVNGVHQFSGKLGL
ncbi:MAG: hypothetical protein HUK20_01040, partial [Fibrobacter sp.]|nr:hypothetical protein [Fibrobacter sp.]